MPSKRKQARKVKRIIKRKVQSQRINEQKQQQNIDQQQMLLKLLATAGMGTGNRTTGMDTTQFLNNREAASILANENARKKRESKLREQQAKLEENKAKNEFEVKVQKQKTEDAERQAKHNKDILDLKEKQQGISGSVAEMQRKIKDAMNRMGVNKEQLDMEAEQHKLQELTRIYDELRTNINYKKMPADLKKLYVTTGEHMDRFRRYINDFNELLKQEEVNEQEYKQMEELSKSYYEAEGSLIQLIQATEFKLGQMKDSTARIKGNVENYMKLQDKLEDLKHQLKLATAENESAGLVYDRDENGNIIKTYDENDLLDEKDPNNMEDLNNLKQKMTDIVNHLASMKSAPGVHKATTSDWVRLLKEKPPKDASRFGKEPSKTADYKRYSKIYDEKMQNEKIKKYTKQGESKNVYETFDELADYFNQLRTEYDTKYTKANNDFEHAKKHNEEVKSRPKPIEQRVTQDMIAKLELEIQEIQDKIDNTKKSTADKNKLKDELRELEAKKERLIAVQNNTPEPELTKEVIDEYNKTKSEVEELERKQEIRSVKEKAINQIQNETEAMKIKNSVDTARLQEAEDKQKEREDAYKKAIEDQLESERIKELNQAKQMTYKHEQDKRIAQLEMNAMNSERIRAANEQIINERAKAQILQEENNQRQKLREAQHQTKETLIAAETMKRVEDLTKGKVQYDDIIGQIKVMSDQINDEVNKHIQDKDYVQKKQDTIIKRLEDDPMLHYEFTKRLERNGYEPIKTSDELRNKFNTRQGVDSLDGVLTQLERPRTPPPPSSRLRPGAIYHIRPPNYLDLDTDEDDDEA